MLEAEARWLGSALEAFDAAQLSPMLNLGSSTLEFRKSLQPYIQREIFDPLERSGVEVVHSDIRCAPGVDLVADILSDSGLAELGALRPRSLLCSNLLEHLGDPDEVARRCVKILPPGGILLVTVPESFPYHFDPVDTLYRPTPAQLAALFPDATALRSASLEAGTYLDTIRERPARVLADAVECARVVARGHHRHARFRWLLRQYRVACVVMRKWE